MTIEIKSIFGDVLFSGDFSSVADCVVAAVKSRAYLTGANLARANLAGEDLDGANLAGAYLARANLAGANLARANLAGANLDGANLAGAYLDGANLDGAYLARANLAGANLARANLAGANLDGANLAGAYLDGANLAGANLDGAIGADYAIASTRILPEGSIIGWKKCRKDRIVRLLVPTDAKRSHAFGRKCRAEFVRVLNVFNKDGSAAEIAVSDKDENTKYTKGATVRCDKWCEDYTQECAGGIHFFITRIEAENYCI
jgi:hypothetical protein